MSRNGHFRLHSPLGTSYSPNAEGSAEGDILGVSAYDDLEGLREDDADISLEGLREDDADIRLGDMGPNAYDGATGAAEGSAEGGRLRQMGVSAYDRRQPEMLVSNGKIGGMVEDHWGTELEGLREDDANISLEGLREDDADISLEGLREDDANISLEGLREDDADIRLEGLREDDANISLEGLREDDADIRLEGAYAHSAAGEAEGDQAWMGDVDDPNAEAARIEQMGAYEIGKRRGGRLFKVADRAAQQALVRAQKGLINSRADADEFVASTVRAAVPTQLPVEDRVKAVVAQVMDKWGPKIDKVIARKISVTKVRMGCILRGLREDDAAIRLGRRRLFVAGAEQYPPQLLAAEGFHERFPVSVDIRGLGRIRGVVKGGNLSSLFEFLKRDPTPEEYLGKIKVLIQSWGTTKPRLAALPAQSKASIVSQMNSLDNAPETYDRVSLYLTEGFAGYSAARWSRIERLDAYLPTVNKLIEQAVAFGASGQVLTPAQATQVAAKDLEKRAEDILEPSFLEKAAPVAGAVGVTGALTLVVLAIGGVI